MNIFLSTASGTQVLVAGGRIAASPSVVDLKIDLGEGVLLPGLINAHDHLHRNHFRRLGSPPYPNAYAWGTDIHARCADAIAHAAAVDRRIALLFGALKNLLGGVTTVVHHDDWEQSFDDFPLRVVRIRMAHSLGFERNMAAQRAGSPATASAPLSMHLAEGVDAGSADEVREAEQLGLLADRLIAVHVVGADADGIERLRRAGVPIVWCPTSNQFLFGQTAPAALLASGLPILIGSDALLTGAGTLLDELAAARGLGLLPDDRLCAAVSTAAAAALGLPPPSLTPGGAADIVFLERPLLDARPSDVGLVMVGGMPRVADVRHAALFDHCGIARETITVGGRLKLVAAPLGSLLESMMAQFPWSGGFLS